MDEEIRKEIENKENKMVNKKEEMAEKIVEALMSIPHAKIFEL